VTSGTYDPMTFDLTQPLIYNPMFVTALGGLPQAEAALIAGIQLALTAITLAAAIGFSIFGLPTQTSAFSRKII
jgi:hypothetical protein